VLDELAPDLMQLWAAHALLDGWGDEHKLIAMETHNGAVRNAAAWGATVKASDFVSPEDFEPFTEEKKESKRLSVSEVETTFAAKFG
tara:strand:+ start:775 stop:1035 length:261 start_codon:yes stop_codon:yes gene_type:complete